MHTYTFLRTIIGFNLFYYRLYSAKMQVRTYGVAIFTNSNKTAEKSPLPLATGISLLSYLKPSNLLWLKPFPKNLLIRLLMDTISVYLFSVRSEPKKHLLFSVMRVCHPFPYR